ncbi:protein-disulfide reductase DsbD domain-containing protein [Roseibium sp.]|uniref:protein-disulfide reductase DsbD domain-containing protein n=1 Tax=Roseibium sp. TaxID=1936156 RepID=UPI003D0BAD7C
MKRIALSLSLALLSISCPAGAAMTDWTEMQGGAVRLISSGPLEDGRYLTGLEFLLEPGWHTYWRYPGEAGLPPQISYKGSENLGGTEVLYPVPERYDDGYSRSIVYHDGVVLPIRVMPDTADKDVRLTVEVAFGICKEVCVPAEASLTLDLAPSDERDDLSARLIERDLAAVPAAESREGLKIASVALSDGGDRLVIETDAPAGTSADLFAAAPEGSYIGLPELAEDHGGHAVWNLSVKGLAVSNSDNTLRLVLVAGHKGVERLVPIAPDWLE